MTTQTPPHQHRVLTPEQRRRRRRRQVATRWGVIGVVLILLVTGGYVVYNYQRFVNGITHIDALPGGATNNKDQNILLVGDDHRPDNATPQELAELGTQDDGGGTSTDTMIIVHLPADGSSATMISLPRDSWVSIPGFGQDKLNAAFTYGSENGGGDAGGAKLLITTIQNLTGLTIDHFVRVSLLGFYNVVNALGPVQVCLNEAVNDPYSAIDLPAGVSTLDASQALSFVRQRHGLPNGDLDREVRQQYFLSVEARQILSAGTLLNPGKLASVLDAISSSIETDSGLNIINLATQMRGLSADKIRSTTIPITGTPTITVDGTDVSIVQVDTAAMPAFIASVIGPPPAPAAPASPSAYDKATASSVGDVTVTVLNGSDSDGVATSNTDALSGFGFKTGTPGDTDSRSTTTIQYPAGNEGHAKAVAAYFPGAALEVASVSDVTVILGSDGIQATDPSAKTDAPAPADPGTAPTTAPAAPTTSYAKGACIN